MKTYQVEVEFIIEEKGLRRGYTLTTYFAARSDYDAVVAAGKWGANRMSAMNYLGVGCITLFHFTPQIPEEDGYIGNYRGMNFFQWKHDTGKPWGVTLEELLDKAIKQSSPYSTGQFANARFEPTVEQMEAYAKRRGMMNFDDFEDAYNGPRPECEYQHNEMMGFYHEYLVSGKVYGSGGFRNSHKKDFKGKL